MNDEITHMLGYLEPRKWVDALQNHNLKKDVLWELIDDQDRTYGGCLRQEIEEELQ